MPTTEGMKGGGFYDAHSDEQRAALDEFLPWLEEAVGKLSAPAGSRACWSLLDVGSSEGANALHAMNRVIAVLRRNSVHPVRVFFDDLPTNNFNQLFTNLFPAGNQGLPGSNIFPAAIAGSAYGQLVPAQSLDVVTTFNMLGWLDEKPAAGLPHYILPMGPSPHAGRAGVSVSDDEREPFRAQAARDLHRFYAARAEELVRGGKALVQVFGRDTNYSTADGIYDVLSDAMLDEVQSGHLPKDVYERLVFPVYFRTTEELAAPLKADEALQKAFRIDHLASREVPVPFNRAFFESGDRTAWAASYTGFLRAFTEAVLTATLPGSSSRSDAVDRIYRRVAERLAAEPARYEFHYISVAVLLTRV